MRRTNLIIIVCCVVAIVALIIFLIFGGERIDNSSMQRQIVTGAPFPEFTVRDIDGKTITQDSLNEKPSIIWFTTSWCIPCQIGAREVARLDNELGVKAFDVLVVFVDVRETEDDLRNWRKKFANEDWIVAFDSEETKLSSRIQLKFLDSKFILDKKGIIQNIDFELADEDYLNTIRKII